MDLDSNNFTGTARLDSQLYKKIFIRYLHLDNIIFNLLNSFKIKINKIKSYWCIMDTSPSIFERYIFKIMTSSSAQFLQHWTFLSITVWLSQASVSVGSVTAPEARTVYPCVSAWICVNLFLHNSAFSQRMPPANLGGQLRVDKVSTRYFRHVYTSLVLSEPVSILRSCRI